MNSYVVGVFAGFCIALLLVLFFEMQVPSALEKIKPSDIPAWWQAVTASLSVLVSLFAAYLVFTTVVETRRITSISLDMLADQKSANYHNLRPWVSIDEIETLSPTEQTIAARITLRNYGNTVALNIRAHLTLFHGPFDGYANGSPIPGQPGLHKNGVTQEDIDYSIKFSLPPGGSYSFLSREIPNQGAGSAAGIFALEYESTVSTNIEREGFIISYKEIEGRVQFWGDEGHTAHF